MTPPRACPPPSHLLGANPTPAQDLLTGGTDEAQRTELLLSLIETFENLSRDPVETMTSSQGAWSAGPPQGTFRPNVVDPERCRNALGAIFEVHGRGQVCELLLACTFCDKKGWERGDICAKRNPIDR